MYYKNKYVYKLIHVHVLAKENAVPSKALINGYFRGKCPAVLKDLNPIEVSMISIINIMSKITMIHGGHFKCNNKIFSVLNKINEVAEVLPRIPSKAEWAILKTEKIGKEYNSNYKFRPKSVIIALEWLKCNNHLYSNLMYDLSTLNFQNEEEQIETFPIEEEDLEGLVNELKDTEITAVNQGAPDDGT